MTDAILTTVVFERGTSDAEIEAAAALAARRRTRAVYFWRYFILVVFLGGWELAVRFKLIDAFFFSSPLAITMRLVEWVVDGASEGSLWYHLRVTMEESLLGYFSGSIAGIVAGIALGRNRMLADVFSIHIKVINSVRGSCWRRFSS